jgi:hypothetical protein
MSGPSVEQLVLTIVPKFSAALSITGSSMIISQVLQSKTNRSNTQQRIVLMMSCTDLMVSGVWLITDLLVPPWSEDYYYALGNQATCSFQGFIVQLSISGVLANASLSIFYVLVIKFGWKMRDVRRFEPYLLALPILFGLGTATAGLALSLYNPASWDCWIAAKPPNCIQSHEIASNSSEQTDCERGDNADVYQWAFFFVPLWLTVLFVSACMITVVLTVRTVEEKAKRWRVQNSAQRDLKHSKKIATQSYLYVGAFFVTWLWPTVARIVQLCNVPIPNWLVSLAGCFIPIQGFFNAVVYFRPRFKNCSRKHQDKSKWWIMRRIISVSLFCCLQPKNTRYNQCDGNDIEGDRKTTTTSASAQAMSDSLHLEPNNSPSNETSTIVEPASVVVATTKD